LAILGIETAGFAGFLKWSFWVLKEEGDCEEKWCVKQPFFGYRVEVGRN
jgi:hypothetical protein